MTVILRQGTLFGLEKNTLLSKKPYISYLGVPYAKPPINDLRFKPPVEHPGWSGELKAFSEGNACVQCHPLFTSNQVIGSEDCLYLNVFVPKEESNEKKAVMVFIHGGAFNFGSGAVKDHSPDYLLDENVIVVTINYRLNVFGFLNLDIDECPGNMGLKDQWFALKWVKENISAFGGDANNITIFGESAGAASVHSHTMSPKSAGLFQRAIMQSGSIFNPWALNEKHRENAFKLAKKLGCQKNDSKEIVEYLKKVSAADLVKNSSDEDNTKFLVYPFLPSVECHAIRDPFLPAHPEILVRTAIPVPIITGVNNMEGLIGIDEPRLKHFDNFRTVEAIHKLFEGCYSNESVNKIKNFYFNENNLERESTRLENIVHLHSDAFFIKDFYRSFNHFIDKNVTPVYNYEFKFDGEVNGVKNILFSTRPTLRSSLKGACHADELSYLFYQQTFVLSPKANSPEFRMCRTMSKLWTNFAKTGNPNSPDLNFEWKKTTLDDPKYLSLDGDNTGMVHELLYGPRVKLWEDISKTVNS